MQQEGEIVEPVFVRRSDGVRTSDWQQGDEKRRQDDAQPVEPLVP
jgi:hypothetical protein